MIIAFLIKHKVTNDNEEADLLARGTIAWNLGRLIHITRNSYMLNYISESEAWQAIEPALPIAQQSFKNWREFGQSYLLGRLMWYFESKDQNELVDLYHYLLKSSKSPWQKIALH